MIKDYVIIDNILENPKSLIDFSKNISYFKNKRSPNLMSGIFLRDDDKIPQGDWLGFRSRDLSRLNHQIFENTFNQIVSKLIGAFNCHYKYSITSYLHYTPETCIFSEKEYHKDPTSLFAGIVYLNETPNENSGTLLKFDNEVVEIDNVFNRLLFYNSNISHRPHNGFGNSSDDARLTLAFFVSELNLDFRWYMKKK
jgi:hypothetical protein